jgi:hypothetical protein
MRSAAPQAAPLATWRWGLAFLLPASVLLVLLVASQRADPDLWGRISIGAVLFEAGHLPRSDDFSYTANGARWIDHEWLSGVVFYALLRASGEPALMFFKYAAAACALALVLAAHRSAYRVSPLWGAGALALLAPLYLAGYLSTIRAQAFSIGFFLLWLAALERVRLGDWRAARLAWLVPLAVLWGNLHGGFVMGVLAVALYAVAYALLRRRADALRHAGLAAALVAAVALVNPYGPVYLGFLLHAWSLDRTGISEWQPLLAGPWSPGNLTLAAVAALGAGLALRALVHGWRSGEIRLRAAGQPRATDARPPVGPALVLLLVVGMTLLARRIHPFMALTLALYLPLLASPSGGRPSRPGRAALVAGVAVPIAGCGALSARAAAARAAGPEELRPRRALARGAPLPLPRRRGPLPARGALRRPPAESLHPGRVPLLEPLPEMAGRHRWTLRGGLHTGAVPLGDAFLRRARSAPDRAAGTQQRGRRGAAPRRHTGIRSALGEPRLERAVRRRLLGAGPPSQSGGPPSALPVRGGAARPPAPHRGFLHRLRSEAIRGLPARA